MAGPSSAGLLAGCQRCGGLWLDHEELGLLARDSITLKSAAFMLAIDEMGADVAAEGSTYRTASRPKGGCPICGEALVETPLQGGVNVDVCDAHGTFFDRSEIRILRFQRAESKAWADTAVLQERERKHKAAQAKIEAEQREKLERLNHMMMDD